MNQTVTPPLDLSYVIEHAIYPNTISFNLEIKIGMSPLVRHLIEQARYPLIEQDCMLVAIVNNRVFKPILGSNYFQILEMACKRRGETMELVFLPTALVYSGTTDCKMIYMEYIKDKKVFINI